MRSLLQRAPVALVATFLLAAPLVSQSAAEPRYTYAELGYVQADFDDFDVDGDGFGFGGSFALNRNIHLLAEYYNIDLDRTRDGSRLGIGVGYNYALRPGLDVVGRFRLLRDDIETVDDDTGFGLEAGLRLMINEQLELNGALRYTDTFDSNTGIVIGAFYDVIPNLALGGDVELSDDYSQVFLRARYYFGPER